MKEVIIRLKDSQRFKAVDVETGWHYTLFGEVRFSGQPNISFFTDSVSDAIRAINPDELESLKI